MSTQLHLPIHDLKHSTCYRQNGKIVIELDEADILGVATEPLPSRDGGPPMGRVHQITDRETFLNTVAHNLAVHCLETDAGCETWTRIAVKKAGEAAGEDGCGAVDISEDDTLPGPTELGLPCPPDDEARDDTVQLPLGFFERPPGQ